MPPIGIKKGHPGAQGWKSSISPQLQGAISIDNISIGLPAGVFVTFLAGLLMAFGVLAMRSSRSIRVRAIAFLLLTAPSLFLIVMAPAILFILINLIV